MRFYLYLIVFVLVFVMITGMFYSYNYGFVKGSGVCVKNNVNGVYYAIIGVD